MRLQGGERGEPGEGLDDVEHARERHRSTQRNTDHHQVTPGRTHEHQQGRQGDWLGYAVQQDRGTQLDVGRGQRRRDGDPEEDRDCNLDEPKGHEPCRSFGLSQIRGRPQERSLDGPGRDRTDCQSDDEDRLENDLNVANLPPDVGGIPKRSQREDEQQRVPGPQYRQRSDHGSDAGRDERHGRREGAGRCDGQRMLIAEDELEDRRRDHDRRGKARKLAD